MCCKSKNSPKDSSLHYINLSENLPQKEISFQSIAELEYIPLETTPDLLLAGDARVQYVSDEYILVSNRSTGDVQLFGRNGKLKYQFNRKGKGGEEYNFIHSVTYDEKNSELFIFDRSSQKILVYQSDGVYKRTLSCPELRLNIFNFDEELLFAYDDYMVPSPDKKYSKRPYVFLSKKDGKVISDLDITFDERYSNIIIKNVVDNEGKPALMPLTVTVPATNFSDGQNFIISDFSSDTIYQLNRKKELVPFLVRTPSIHENGRIKHLLSMLLKTKNFVYLRTTEIDLDISDSRAKVPLTDIFYDLNDNNMFVASWVNNDITSIKNWNFQAAETSENIGVCFIEAYVLLEASKAGILKGKLQQVASELNEEDNPVVMIAKFK